MDEESPLLATSFPNPDTIQSSPSSPSPSRLYPQFLVRLRYYVPVFGWLPSYDIANLKDDIIAGMTVATLIIPQALSYASSLVNLPPLLGLYSAFIPQIVYSMLGTSRQLAIGFDDSLILGRKLWLVFWLEVVLENLHNGEMEILLNP